MNPDSNEDIVESRPGSPSLLKTRSSMNSNDSIDIRMDDYFNQNASKFRSQQQISLTQKNDSSANLIAA
jgi:hypothetical protein